MIGNKEGAPMTPHQANWEHLATAASKEKDPEKLVNLVHELNGVLCEREETPRKRHQGKWA
jgi:hypothetical protein